jgi:hypothetical protein
MINKINFGIEKIRKMTRKEVCKQKYQSKVYYGKRILDFFEETDDNLLVDHRLYDRLQG